jgi:putative SOS response-associated peptidase YedK
VCGRFTSRTPIDDVVAAFEVDDVVAPDLGSRWNVAPTDEVYAVAEVDGRRRLGALRWGLVPWWADDPRIGSRMINARCETLATKPAFRRLLARRRCLVPADGFYEWRKASGGRPKQAFHLRHPEGRLLAFAGLWDRWRPEGSDDDALVTCTIVTAPAPSHLAGIHHRSPVVLEPGAWSAWLDTDLDDAGSAQALLVPSGELVPVPVSDAVNDVRNDGPHLVEPVAEAECLESPALLDGPGTGS